MKVVRVVVAMTEQLLSFMRGDQTFKLSRRDITVVCLARLFKIIADSLVIMETILEKVYFPQADDSLCWRNGQTLSLFMLIKVKKGFHQQGLQVTLVLSPLLASAAHLVFLACVLSSGDQVFHKPPALATQ